MLATTLNSNNLDSSPHGLRPADRASRRGLHQSAPMAGAARSRRRGSQKSLSKRAGAFHHRLETRGKPAGLGFIGVERRNAVRNDDKLQIGLLLDSIRAILHLVRYTGIGRTCTSLLLLRSVVQVLIKGRLTYGFILPGGG